VEATVFNRKAALFAVLTAFILTSGALILLADANGGAHGPMPPQISPFDMMSKAQGLPDQKIETPF
jgi:hypothetical protein